VIRNSQDMFGTSIFVKDDGDAIFHSYSTYHRGAELPMGALNWLDLVPKGRNESFRNARATAPCCWIRGPTGCRFESTAERTTILS
jgi:predicted dithiol-disulfide oxidoreductase (DUF899 family)